MVKWMASNKINSIWLTTHHLLALNIFFKLGAALRHNVSRLKNKVKINLTLHTFEHFLPKCVNKSVGWN